MPSDRAPRPRSGSLVADVRVETEGGAIRLDAAIEIPPGVTILFGPSGAGKSTLLAAIAGLVRPTRGRVALGDETWLDRAAGVDVPVHARRIALVFQGLALFPHMSALENVAYGIPGETTGADRRARAAASLDRFRAAHLANRKPSTYSGGEAQRVALARAFAMQPRLVMLDEPFSAMDRELRRELMALVPTLADDLGVPVLHVTHHRGEARAIGDRVILLAEGRVRSVGSAANLLGEE